MSKLAKEVSAGFAGSAAVGCGVGVVFAGAGNEAEEVAPEPNGSDVLDCACVAVGNVKSDRKPDEDELKTQTKHY